MEFPLIHISDIIPPLYQIVIHLCILVGYPSYRDKRLYLWSPYLTSWNIIILSRVKHPYREILAIFAWHSSTEKRETHHELLTILRVTPTCRPLLPYVPKLDIVLQILGLTFLWLQFLAVVTREDMLCLRFRRLPPCVWCPHNSSACTELPSVYHEST